MLSTKTTNEDLQELFKKAEELQEHYEDHDTIYQNLRLKCNQAEQKANNLTSLGKRWSKKVANLQDGLTAFEMTQIYESIAETLNKAHKESTETLNQYKLNKDKLETLQEDTEKLKEDSEQILKNTQNEMERKVKAEFDLENLNKAVYQLDHQKNQLEKNLDKIDQWINRTMSSAKTLADLENELDTQQNTLNTNELKAKEIIDKIQTLESLRKSDSNLSKNNKNKVYNLFY